MGGTASLVVASREEVNGVISFSGPVEFEGISAIDSVKDMQLPKLFMASRGDGTAANSANTLYENSPEPKDILILNGNSHGTFIFKEEPENAEIARQKIFDFLDNN